MARIIGAAERVMGPLERVVVLRAVSLGGMLCATPALRALRAGLPGARITLVTLPEARALAQRLDCVDEVLSFPGYPGLPGASDLRALPGLLAQLQIRRFDLAIQLQDGGAVTNPLVAAFGARHMAGFRSEGHWVPAQDERWMVPWTGGHEIERLLRLTDNLGLPRMGTQLDFPLREEDHSALNALWPGAALGLRPYVCVHPGGRRASRCWPPERFAAVADALVASGFTVVLTGTALESPRVNAVVQHMRHKAVNLAGLTSLWTLGALIERAHGLVCNDTGVSHMAVALGRPSVVIGHGGQGGEGTRWQPLDRERHQFLSQDDTTTWREPGRLLLQPGEAGVRVEAVLRCLDFEADKPWRGTFSRAASVPRACVLPVDMPQPRQLPVDRQRESALQG